MSSSQDKQLPATERKLQKARSDGQAARSRDLSHLAILGVGALGLLTLAPWFVEYLQRALRQQLVFDAATVQATGTVQALREQMDLPLWFDVRVAPADFEAVRAVLGHLPVGAVEAHDDHVAVQCARESKMAVIAALASLDGKVLDLSVREPSLEDVFFGFSD